MQIERTHQIDSSEPDESGMYDYYYEYDIYRFTEDSVSFIARSYTDEPDEAHFLKVETNGVHRLLNHADLKHPLLLSALSHLRNEGKMNVRWLNGKENGYESLPTGLQ
jgi:hypothetical protein